MWIPLRWLPAESVFEDDFSTKSDVWVFGVLVWEVFNHGELPYTKLSDDEVLEGQYKSIEMYLVPTNLCAPLAEQSLFRYQSCKGYWACPNTHTCVLNSRLIGYEKIECFIVCENF